MYAQDICTVLRVCLETHLAGELDLHLHFAVLSFTWLFSVPVLLQNLSQNPPHQTVFTPLYIQLPSRDFQKQQITDKKKIALIGCSEWSL